MKKKWQTTLFLLVGAWLLVSCRSLPSTSQPNDIQALYTSAAQTVIAQVTASAQATPGVQATSSGQPVETATAPAASVTPGIIFPTSPGASTQSAPATNTQSPPPAPATPTATLPPPPTPTFTLPPTATPVPPTATPIPPTPIPCNMARFIRDVTVADGTTLSPGSRFTKVWRIRNDGACTWDSSYRLVFSSGTMMADRAEVPFDEIVYPGETVDLSIEMTAPRQDGSYRGYWLMRDPYGNVFGLNDEWATPLWVDIRVEFPANHAYAYDFAANFCAARWSTGAGPITCGEMQNSQDGSVSLLEEPALESRRENEPALLTRPNQSNNGWISGLFPSYTVQPGDRFVAELGCLADSGGCSVNFQLNYQDASGQVRSLGSWDESYEGRTTVVQLDLGQLAGVTARFILTVYNEGRPANANAVWFVPSIRNQAVPVNQTAELARLHLAQQLVINANDIRILSIESVVWNDSCLEFNRPELYCVPVVLPGFRILMAHNNRQYEVRTNQDASLIYFVQR